MENKKQKLIRKYRLSWKWLFLILLAINLALLLHIASRIFINPEPQLTQTVNRAKMEEQVGKVIMTTDELNSLINNYLNTHPVTADGDFQFYVSSSNSVISMDYKFFGSVIPIHIYFQPATMTDGSILLTVQSISAGMLNVPPTAALSYIRTMKLPPFVNVDSSSNSIQINLNALSIGNFYFHAQTIDLANGNFVFDILRK